MIWCSLFEKRWNPKNWKKEQQTQWNHHWLHSSDSWCLEVFLPPTERKMEKTKHWKGKLQQWRENSVPNKGTDTTLMIFVCVRHHQLLAGPFDTVTKKKELEGTHRGTPLKNSKVIGPESAHRAHFSCFTILFVSSRRSSTSETPRIRWIFHPLCYPVPFQITHLSQYSPVMLCKWWLFGDLSRNRLIHSFSTEVTDTIVYLSL